MALRFRIGGSPPGQKRSAVQGCAGTRSGTKWCAAACNSARLLRRFRLWAFGFRLWAVSKSTQSSKPKAQSPPAIEPADFARARRVLMRRDPVLARVIKQHRTRSPLDAPALEPFPALVRTITAQPTSTKPSATNHGRLIASIPDGVTPKALLSLSDDQFRQAGLSRQKIGDLRDLASKVKDGALPVGSLHELDDEAVIEAIVTVKGLGRWSAEMFLMFRLRRPDVLPVDDLGIVTALSRLYGLGKKPP